MIWADPFPGRLSKKPKCWPHRQAALRSELYQHPCYMFVLFFKISIPVHSQKEVGGFIPGRWMGLIRNVHSQPMHRSLSMCVALCLRHKAPKACVVNVFSAESKNSTCIPVQYERRGLYMWPVSFRNGVAVRYACRHCNVNYVQLQIAGLSASSMCVALGAMTLDLDGPAVVLLLFPSSVPLFAFSTLLRVSSFPPPLWPLKGRHQPHIVWQ